jgi:non-specific serine/threonine protein kinase
MLPPKEQPLVDFTGSEQQWAHVRYEILQAVKRAALRRTAPAKEEAVVAGAMPGDSGTAAITETQAPRHNLPVQRTSFVGRKQELADLARLLETTHLLTLTGSGGCGKTRLALEAAGGLVERFAEGVWLVQLASLTDPALVANQVAIAFGLNLGADQDPLERVTAHLATRSILLLLDNCEHVLEGAAPLAEALLASCPGLRLLATSRTPLRVAGEQIYRVPPLSLPEPGSAVAKMTEAELRGYDAVSLFMDRARAAQPTFQATGQNAVTLTELCRRLDGMPLALELAAARLSALPLEEIAKRLEDRFRLLTAGSRTALPRHQTLRALIDWSYNILSEAQQALLLRLSVFAGAWTLAAAEAVCSGEGVAQEQVIELVADLVDNSLFVPVITPEGEDRFRLLETVRQYAAEKLEAAGETQRWRDRHYEYFAQRAEQLHTLWHWHDDETQPGRPWADGDDYHAALAHGGSRLTLPNLGLISTMCACGLPRGELAGLVCNWLDHDSGEPTLLKGEALKTLAAVAVDPKEQCRLTEAAAQIFRQLGDDRRSCVALWLATAINMALGEEEKASLFSAEAADVAHRSGDPALLLHALRARLAIPIYNADSATSRSPVEEYLETALRLGLAGAVAYAYELRTQVEYWGGDLGRARVAGEECVVRYRQLGDPFRVLSNRLLGDIARAEGNYPEARRHYRDSMDAWWEQGFKLVYSEILLRVGCLLIAEARAEAGVRLVAAAARLNEEMGTEHQPIEDYESVPALAAAREALTKEAFEQAWTEGQALPLETAVALCRAELEAPDPISDEDDQS